MATRPKAVIESRNGEKFSPITIAKNVLTDDGQNLHDILSDRKEDMMTPTIENSSSMFKVGQGDNVDYSSNVVNSAYESMVLKGKTMVNCIQESSSKDVVLPYEFADGQYVTINDTKESGALGVELKGQTSVNSILSIDKTLPYTWVSNSINSRTCALRGAFKTGVYALIVEFGEVLLGGVQSSQGVSSAIQVNYTDGTSNSYTRSGLENYSKKRFFTTFTINKEVVSIEFKGTGAQYENATTEGYVPPTVTINKIMILEYQEGMENWDIPYFEGMTSCKMPTLHTVGKNLFNINGYSTKNQYASINGNTITVNAPTTFSNTVYTLTGLKEGELYRVSLDKTGAGEFSIRDTNASSLLYVEKEEGHVSRTFTYEKGATIRIGNRQIVNSEVSFANIQIEHGSTETTYEPYKSSILSLPEEVVLRSLPNGVCDTFNTRIGVYTQRIGEYVFQDTENATYNRSPISDNKTETSAFRHNAVPTFLNMKTCSTLYCDKFPTIDGKAGNGVNDFEYVKTETTNPFVWFNVKKSKLPSDTIEGFKQWLSQNPITIQYELATPIITKINLSSTLKSWNTTTHIYSEIPENTLYPILSHSNPSYPVILKPSTKYSIVANSYSNNHTNSTINFNLGGVTASTTVGNRVTTVTTPSTLSNELLTMSGRGNKLSNVMVVEGDVVGDEPYFEGICDVKSPILSNFYNVHALSSAVNQDWGLPRDMTVTISTGQLNYHSCPPINVASLRQKRVYVGLARDGAVLHKQSNFAIYFDSLGQSLGSRFGIDENGTVIPQEATYMRLMNYVGNQCTLDYIGRDEYFISPVKFNVGDKVVYKSNTTTFKQKDDKTIVLRSLPNGVCDTLNVITGEHVQRIGEVVLDGSKTMSVAYADVSDRTTLLAHMAIANMKIVAENNINDLNVDKMTSEPHSIWSKSVEGVHNKNQNIYVNILKSRLVSNDWSGVQQWLSQNPITVQYELATPIVTTIDIQGFPYAYTNGHVQLSSGHSGQSLTPKVEYSVATNRNGQIRSNQKMVERHQKQLDRLQAMVLTNLVNTQYEQTLTNLKYDLKNVREEVK